MAARLDVALRTAEAVYQEIAQALLRTLQVVLGIHRGEQVVGRNLLIKRLGNPRDAVFAKDGVDGVQGGFPHRQVEWVHRMSSV